MANLVVVLACLGLGALLARAGRLPASAPAVLSRVVVDVALPALVFVTVHDLPFDPARPLDLVAPALAPLCALAVAVVVAVVAAYAAGWSCARAVAIVLTAGFANTSFVGFPLVEALYGAEGLRTAVLADQASFLLVATAGTALVALGGGAARPPFSAIARTVGSFPPFVALVVAVATRPLPLPPSVSGALARLGALVVPLALLAVGARLRVERSSLARNVGPLALGLATRLVLAPAVVALVLRGGLAIRGLACDVSVAEAAMAPMITSALLALESGIEPELASWMIGLGVPLSLVTVPLWAALLR